MTADELDKLERERLRAERSYNETLTSLDQAVVAAMDSGAPAEALRQFGSALMVFMQQITAFVETKDRQLMALLQRRVDGVASSLEELTELRVQVGVLQRTMRSGGAPSAPRERDRIEPSGGHAIAPQHDVGDVTYLGFEDQFRGSDAEIRERLRPYVALFAGRTDVLDIGCGRGELLAEFAAAGIAARGIDANPAMAAVARARGLDATAADALGFVRSLPDESLGGLVATQVIEHLEPSYLLGLIHAAAAKLQPGAPIVLETINPACWLAFFSSYIRDLTHVRPIHPDTLQYLLRASGFSGVAIRYSAPVPEPVKMKTVDLPAEMFDAGDAPTRAVAGLAHAVNTNATILNNLMFTHLDYAAIGYRS